jgi:hypothetical protein
MPVARARVKPIYLGFVQSKYIIVMIMALYYSSRDSLSLGLLAPAGQVPLREKFSGQVRMFNSQNSMKEDRIKPEIIITPKMCVRCRADVSRK